MPAKPSRETPSYDVFISYSHADADWVGQWLVPRLKGAGLKVCTDRESFDVGVPSLVNMENAVTASRHTLLILTEAWVGSQWTRYEALLAQGEDPAGMLRRILPVLRQPCTAPRRISMLTYADLSGRRDVEAEFARLLDAIRGVRWLPDAGSASATLGLEGDLARYGMAGEAGDVEARYRADLAHDLRWHDFRGIYQFKQAIRLPLADIYQELGLLRVASEREHRQARESLLAMGEEERLAAFERRLQERVADALARSQRLVILGDPGAGKTVSLDYIALMLAGGQGAARLGLAAPYLPIKVRAAYFAQALQTTPALSLDVYLQQFILQAFTSHPRLGEFVRLALQRGVCMVLLDGLDEVGDDARGGQKLRTTAVKRVQQFADRWCTEDRPNRLVVTSRIEGYWGDPLSGCDHVELSPLSPPDEVERFLLRWYGAYEQDRDHSAPPEMAADRAKARVAGMLPQLMDAPGVKRLATNPLLLTILVLIYENVGKLPNRRARLYETCTKTLIESWRQEQTEHRSQVLVDLGEETITRVVAALAYWLHERRPGGTAPLEDCRRRMLAILTEEEGYDRGQAEAIRDELLSYASGEAGLFCERGLGQYGFFHLTFEEYLAAYHLTRQAPDRRRAMLAAHWEDDRWQEVILLAAGQLGVVENKPYDAGAFLADLREMEPADPAKAGRPAVLAGRALADIGPHGVNQATRRDVMRELRCTMQDLDPEAERPNDPPRIPVRTRYAAGETLDELGWQPDGLDAWIYCPGCADGEGDLLAAKYPVTNAQFERFMAAGGYENPAYWDGEKSPGWRWRVKDHNVEWRGEGPVTRPEYWQRPRFGRDRRGYPVVGVSWYEAAAYAAWLAEQARAGDYAWHAWRGGNLERLGPRADAVVRLPSEAEWERLAGGSKGQDRYPWDPPQGPATRDQAAVLARANTYESGIGGTSPVGMYPLGASRPFGLWDLAGNVWEWTGAWYDRERTYLVVRGGSWNLSQVRARVSARLRLNPGDYGFGFRVVSPIVSGS